ncbi:MAG: hypothetical protein CME65_06165 [Halobacteriovoraceae bacterium]|nr:hypothetical protein [Halobacteriovoraceae bacterium]|tara:strand:+ start:4380 stop:5477 length:1098 start_codon:yes stop_codon:yes gene_type:complete
MALMRYYLDYNSTHPVLPEVYSKLATINGIDANSSSQHSRGKSALKKINQTTEFLKNFFHCDFDVIYHSGATEFLNTVFSPQNCDQLIYSQCDHSAVHKIAEFRRSLALDSLKLGHLSSQKDWLKELNKFNQSGFKSWFNFQWMNNETGEVLSYELIDKIKSQTNCLVHVDAVQVVGKIKNFQNLPPNADIITFSGHKFGALKGVGFSFINPSIKLKPLIHGGGQQNSMRSGTMNLHGILSLQAALESRDFNQDFIEGEKLKREICQLIQKNSKLEFIQSSSSNTICFMHESLNSDAMLTHFDLAGLDVGTGSACTSGSLSPSQTLEAMGYQNGAKRNIRLSLGPSNWEHQSEILIKLEKVLDKI